MILRLKTKKSAKDLVFRKSFRIFAVEFAWCTLFLFEKDSISKQ